MGMKNNLNNMIYLFIIFGLIGNRYPVNAQLSNINTLRKFAADAYDIMKGIYETHSESPPTTDDIINEMDNIIVIIENLDRKWKEKWAAINTLTVGLLLPEAIELDVHNLTEYTMKIRDLYNGEFWEYVEKPESLTEDKAAELSELYTSEDGDVVSTIHEMFSVISPDTWGNYKNSLLFIIAQEVQKIGSDLCDIDNLQQTFLDYHSIIVVTEMKALTMIDFGYLLKSFKENVSYVDDMERIKEEFERRVEKYVIILRRVLKTSKNIYRNCDPPKGHKRDVTFYEFERFIQRIVVDEVTVVHGDCKYLCWNIPNPTRQLWCDGIGCHNGVKVCQGNIRGCLEMGEGADFCRNNHGETRKYEWIKDGWGYHHPAEPRVCTTGSFHWPRAHREASMLWLHCDICRCLCVEETVASPSSHFISLREQLSDVADNMVIVGLKFRIVDKILHLDIWQCPLGNNSIINGDKARWKAPEDIQYDREGSIRSRKFKFYKSVDDDNREEMIEDKDVAVLTYDSRRIGLDTLTAPEDHVVTGVKFSRHLKQSGKPIYLEVQVTPFDFKSGKLDSGNSLWIGPKDTAYGLHGDERSEYEGEGFENPEKSEETVIDSGPNMFIDVDWSSWDLDASQTVIPFLEGRVAGFSPPVGLTSVGLYHKKQKGHGGFLTFVVEGMDLIPPIENPLPGRYKNKANN